MNYFEGCKTLQELKTAYRRAAMANHPDRGGDEAIMKEINLSYEKAFNCLQNEDTREAASSRKASEAPNEFIKIIEVLMNLQGIEIELCNMWVWISGETLKHREILKDAGCKWAPKKKMWYWHPAGYESAGRGKTDMDKIRNKYGSIRFAADGTENTYQRERLSV